MSTKIYVSNLSYNTTDETLQQAFSEYGNVVESVVTKDTATNQSRGYGFVTFSTPEEAANAISAMDRTELDGRRIQANIDTRHSG
ncbi:Nucleolin [Dactylellina cionopaga]|nr:Nucleolin [Dactylellina cionopaga]